MPPYCFNEFCVGVKGSEAFPEPVDYSVYSLVSYPCTGFWPEGLSYLFTADNSPRGLVKEFQQSELEGRKGRAQFFPPDPNFTSAFVQLENWLLWGEWSGCSGVHEEEFESKGYGYLIPVLQSVRGGYQGTVDESTVFAPQIFQDEAFTLACYTGMEARDPAVGQEDIAGIVTSYGHCFLPQFPDFSAPRPFFED